MGLSLTGGRALAPSRSSQEMISEQRPWASLEQMSRWGERSTLEQVPSRGESAHSRRLKKRRQSDI